ncbi:PHD-finger family protein, putative, partial [Ichthyophthirius multifiliis]
MKVSPKYFNLTENQEKQQKMNTKIYQKTKPNLLNNSKNEHMPKKRCFNQYCQKGGQVDLIIVQDKSFKKNGNSKEKIYYCSKCFERYRGNQYCQYCKQIYFDTNEVDGEEWIQCDECDFWLHKQCEAQHGIENIDEFIKRKEKYECPRCRLRSKKNEVIKYMIQQCIYFFQYFVNYHYLQ